MIDADVSAATGRTTLQERPRKPRGAAVSVSDPLATRSDELLALIKSVGSKAKPREVHKLRTTIRRVEALLPETEVAAGRNAERVRKQLARLRSRAGKVRDADVHVNAIRSLSREPDTADGRAVVLAHLAKRRGKWERRLMRGIAVERERGLVKRLRRVVGVGAGADASHVLSGVRARFDEAFRGASPLSADNLHAFRIQTKRLRYIAEAALPSPDAVLAVAQLKRTQDAIGAWHDWRTLLQRAERALGDAPAPALFAAIRARAETTLAKALTVTAQVERRLHALGADTRRKGVHSVATTATSLPVQSAGASA